jgi:CRISPR/Cas system-associated exonuclease Cas4 (RecB family)
MLTYSRIPSPISAQNQLPGNMGVGIRSDVTAKSEKKASKMVIPFMFYFDLDSRFLGLPDFIRFCMGKQAIINVIVFQFNKNRVCKSYSNGER